MIRPALQDDALLADIWRAGDEPGVRLWWLGQSGFLLQHNGRHLLFDPYLSDSLTKKYAATDKPHVRMTQRVIDPARLDFIDVVTSSHNHTDHLDAETLLPIFAANPRVRMVVAEANRELAAARLGLPAGRLDGLDAGQKLEAAGFDIHAVPAAHETLDRDTLGRHQYLGFVVRCGAWTIYHSGDTVLYEGMVDMLKKFEIDAALLPINGADPARRVAGNLNGAQAARLAREIGAELVIPCHFEMFEFNTASPLEFEQTARELSQRFRTLRAGERCDLGSWE